MLQSVIADNTPPQPRPPGGHTAPWCAWPVPPAPSSLRHAAAAGVCQLSTQRSHRLQGKVWDQSIHCCREICNMNYRVSVTSLLLKCCGRKGFVYLGQLSQDFLSIYVSLSQVPMHERYTYINIYISCHVMSCHVMSCHVMSCHVMSGQVRSGQVRSGHVTIYIQNQQFDI